MNVTITNVEVEVGKPGPKGWSKAVVDYVGPRGPTKTNVMSFKAPALFKQIADFVGKTVEVTQVQNDKGYWEWTGVKETGGPVAPPPATGGTTTYKSDRETPEERAKRQVMIVKQSSLAQAVALLGPKAKKEEAVEVAQYFADWVLDIEDPQDPEFDDIPL